jgi:O-antigen/teichoic acid export membrane protein
LIRLIQRLICEAKVNVPVKGRASRILEGWSANLVQTALGIVQQIALVPVFLHFWTSDVLAAWLTLYSAGYFVLIVDAGLQMSTINRFLAAKGSVDPDGATARFYAAMLRLYIGLALVVAAVLLIGAQFLPPSTVLGFSTAHFDAAFLVMTVGMVLTLPTNLLVALYRARGLYGRIVKIQCWSMLGTQIGEVVALVTTESLLIVTLVYVTAQVLLLVYLFYLDVPRLFPFLRQSRATLSWHWVGSQLRSAFPFAIVNAAESAIVYLPVLFVSAFVSDRVAVAQWGLTRVIAGLVRGLSFQMTLPLASELGHDHAVGKKQELQNLYARGSVFVTLLASIAVSGLLAFWPDFFALWTHDAIPFDPLLTATLLIGTSVVAPSILALSYASYSDRGRLLAWTKGLQLLVFLLLSVVLIPVFGPLGAALAITISDLLIQFGLLTVTILRDTLQRPLRHVALLVVMMLVVISLGWGGGVVIRSVLPMTGLPKFIVECGLWTVAMALLGAPLANLKVRTRLIAAIPR